MVGVLIAMAFWMLFWIVLYLKLREQSRSDYEADLHSIRQHQAARRALRKKDN